MRAFARPFPLQRLSLEARVLYSAFLIFVLVGVATSLWLYDDDGFGVSGDNAVVYYRGEAAAPSTPAASAGAGGVALALPDDVVDRPLRLEKPARQVVETFHFHAFTMPVLLLILGHIFMMCSLSTSKKVAVLLVSSTSTLLHLLLPPLVRFASPSWAVLFAPTAIAMAVTWLLLLIWPLIEMWWPSSSSSSSVSAGDPDAGSG